MNLDRFCQLFVLGLLPLLFLPFSLLPIGFVIGGLCFLPAILWRCYRWAILGGLLIISYGHILSIANYADKMFATQEEAVITISQILSQSEFQTAIAERENGTRIFINWRAKIPLKLENRYKVTLNSRPISNRLNQGNFDRQKWYFSHGILQVATVKQATLLENDSVSLRTRWLESVQQQTKSLALQGLLLALAFGERGWLLPQEWQIFQKTSTAHLIAISGLHIALAFGFGIGIGKGIQWLYWQFKRGQAVRYAPFFTKIIGFVIAVGYSYLAGFSVPTLRALLAMSLIFCLQLARRHYTPWQYWWRTVALLLLFDNLSLLSTSFWLSILAVASLILWYQFFPLRRFLPEKGKKIAKPCRLFLSLCHLQIGIWLLFLPVQLYFFEGVSPFSLIDNLLIVPFYSLVIIPLILFSLLTDNLFSTWLVADWLVQGSIRLLIPLSKYWIPLSFEQQWQLLSINLVVIWGLLAYQWGIKKGKWIGIFILLFNRLPALVDWASPKPSVQWVNFDIGQGLAMALIYSQNGKRKAILYDTGASWQGGSMADLEIIPYLQRQGVELEAVFVSHVDNDHSGGVPSILQAYPNTRLILSQYTGFRETQIEHCLQGKVWRFGHISLQAIYPKQLAIRAKNEDSCVLLAQIGQYRLLFTGDSGIKQEREFVQEVGKIDFLQVGHHGSNTSSSHLLLATSQPTVAVISAGRWNPWRLPTQQVAKRLDQYHILSFNTAKAGMVTVDFYADYYKIRQERYVFSPWYQAYLAEKSPYSRAKF